MPAPALLVYVPTLHKALAPARLPETVAFLHPGLPGLNFRAHDLCPGSYPFPPEAARVQLADLLAFGESMARTKDGIRIQEENTRLQAAILPVTEKEALAHFSATGKASEASDKGAGTADAPLQSAHKALLLTWDLEERLLEIKTLEEKVAMAWAELQSQLHDTEATSPPPATEAPEEAPWRATLGAMAAFLPPESILVSGHAELRLHLLEGGMLHPLPEDMAESLPDWDTGLLSATLWAHLPLWRILGNARAPEAKPWLLQTHDILIIPAEKARPA